MPLPTSLKIRLFENIAKFLAPRDHCYAAVLIVELSALFS